jgi:S1-C subfamily serine protease
MALAAAILMSVFWKPFLGAEDTEGVIQALVRVRTTVPADASTAAALGTEREGNGIVIGPDGLILTIGYLIVEASSIEIQTTAGEFHADYVGYDSDTGFGLIRAPSTAKLQPIQLGESSSVKVGDELEVGGFGTEAQPAQVVSRAEFVGNWEYLLDSAIYATPPFRDFGGAALIDEGKLVGVGSIFETFYVVGVGRIGCDMFVPIDLLKPILQEMVHSGHSGSPPRPWLGLTTTETEGRVVVTMVTPGGPAEQAGLRPGDVILTVGQKPVAAIAELYRQVWSTGSAGVNVRLRVLQGNDIHDLTVKSMDHAKLLSHSSDSPAGAPEGPTT